MRALLIVLLCWVALPPVSVAAPRPYHSTRERRISLTGQPPKTRALVRRVRADLYRIVLPDITVHAVSFRDAIEPIRQGFRERHPEQSGLGIFFKLRPGEPVPPPVSLTLHSACTAEALDALCAYGDYVWCVDAFALAIVPAEESALIQRRPSR